MVSSGRFLILRGFFSWNPPCVKRETAWSMLLPATCFDCPSFRANNTWLNLVLLLTTTFLRGTTAFGVALLLAFRVTPVASFLIPFPFSRWLFCSRHFPGSFNTHAHKQLYWNRRLQHLPAISYFLWENMDISEDLKVFSSQDGQANTEQHLQRLVSIHNFGKYRIYS